MKLLSSGSHNIAWFKLAEFVARGEKERALSVYKLLMHSVADQAFAYQLEGDLLSAFDDTVAIDRYHKAADVYKKQKNYQKAIAVCEHVVASYKDLVTLEKLVDLYDYLQDKVGLVQSFARFAALAVQTKNIELAVQLMQKYSDNNNIYVQAQLHEHLFFACLLHGAAHDLITTYLEETIQLYLCAEKLHELTKFMAKVKALDELFYQRAQDVLTLVKN